VPSLGICTQCGKGWCAECVKSQGSARICPACDALCVAAADQEAKEARARMRARPLMDELATVFSYPFSDKMAYLLLAVFVGVFSVAASLAAFGSALAILLSQGLLYAYAFTAINRVSAGDLKSFMPDVGDIGDLIQPMRVGLAALLISTGPLLALSLLHPPNEILAAMGAPAALGGEPAPTPTPSLSPELQALREEAAAGNLASAEPADPEDGAQGDEPPTDEAPAPGASEAAGLDSEFREPGIPGWVFAAFVLAVLWKLLYSPVALVAAAISRGFLATLNPLAGIGAILRMGGTYWSAMAIYSLIALVEIVLVTALGMIPLAGRFLAAFVQSYSYLAIGCLLGFAVFKKAPELGLD
jgi:hypothetical protein